MLDETRNFNGIDVANEWSFGITTLHLHLWRRARRDSRGLPVPEAFGILAGNRDGIRRGLTEDLGSW